MHTLDQQMAGLAALLTRRTDELIAAVNGSAADPVRALSALTGQLRSEVAEFQRNAAQRRGGDDPTLGRNDRRVAEAVDRAGGGVRRLLARDSNPQRRKFGRGSFGRRRPAAQRTDIGDRQSRSNQRRHRPGDRIGRGPARRRSERARRAGRRIPACAKRHRLTGRDPGPAFSHHPVRREHARAGSSPSTRKRSPRSDGISPGSSSRSTTPSSTATTTSRRSSAISRAGARLSRRRSGDSRPTSKTASPGRKLALRRSAPRSHPPQGARRSRSPANSKPFATRRPRSASEPRRRCKRPSNRPTRS